MDIKRLQELSGIDTSTIREKMLQEKKAEKDFDKDGEVESSEDEHKGVVDKKAKESKSNKKDDKDDEKPDEKDKDDD